MPLYLIFDFDGVIGDTWEAAITTHLNYKSQPNREAALEEMHRYFNTKPHHTKNHTLTPEQLAKEYTWTTEFGLMMYEVGFPLFTDFVAEIEKIDTPFKAVVSSGSKNYVVPALAQTNIHPTHTLTFEDHHSKEDKIETICKDWDVPIREVYYVTDSLADVYELQNFITPGKLIGVAWGYSGKTNLLKELPDKYILDTPAEIRNILV